MNYELALQKVLDIQHEIRATHPLFEQTYPIAIVEEDTFHIFDVDTSDWKYHFMKQAPTPMPIPRGVRAAFDLECYDNKIACVVSSEVFDTLDGYVTILHEFVHCYQASTCEERLKQSLEIARLAMAANDYMWEINHPFPYGNAAFIDTYAALLQGLGQNTGEDIRRYRRQLAAILKPVDFEYMIWQEWKEGFARYIENRLQRQLGLAENHYGLEQPFHRRSFYEGGAGMIACLSQAEPALCQDIEKLFWSIRNA